MPLLAFSFGAPWLLWGLAMGVLPILIHLLSRRKHREVEWAAMRFLLDAVRKNARRIQLEQWLLLLIRTLIIVGLILGLAEPRWESLKKIFTTTQPIHRIVVLDASFSMGAESGGQTRFVRAQSQLRKILEGARQGDAWNLIRMAASEPRVIIREASYQVDEVTREVDQLTVSAERGDVYSALRETERLLRTLPQLTQKEVVIVSDWQQASWQPDAGGKPAEIRGLMNQISGLARLSLLDLGGGEVTNQAITDFRVREPIVLARQPANFRVAVSTFGSAPVTSQLEFLVDGRVQESHPVTLTPGTETVLDLQYTFLTGGEHQLVVRLTKDNLPIDDQRQLVVVAKDQLNVLCVNGKLAGQPRETATYHLAFALSPYRPDDPHPGMIQTRVIKYGELRGFDLSQYDCVFLCDISAFETAEAQLLETYLRGGGGVIWCLGERVVADNYNRLLYRDGKGILPVKLLERQGDARLIQREFGFDSLEFAHPIVKVFQRNPDGGLERTQTFEYVKTQLPEQGQSRVALAYDSGDPAIVEMPVGLGKALLITTAVDQSWGNWAIWPSFVPLIQEMVLWSVSGSTGERQTQIREALQRVVQSRGADLSVVVKRPDEETEPANVLVHANLSTVSYDRTDLPGVYQINLGPPLNRTEVFAVNVDTHESPLAKLERDAIERELLNGADFDYSTEWIPKEREAVTTTVSVGGELSHWILYVVLYLLAVEQLMAWQFRYGLWLLCPPLAIAHWLKRK